MRYRRYAYTRSAQCYEATRDIAERSTERGGLNMKHVMFQVDYGYQSDKPAILVKGWFITPDMKRIVRTKELPRFTSEEIVNSTKEALRKELGKA